MICQYADSGTGVKSTWVRMCAQESASGALDYAPSAGMRPVQAPCPGQQECAEPSTEWHTPLCKGQLAEPKNDALAEIGG